MTSGELLAALAFEVVTGASAIRDEGLP